MTNTNINIDDLIKENENLKRKLAFAQNWMEKEVKGQIAKITQKEIKKWTISWLDNLLRWDDIQKICENRIIGYFGELLLMNAPKWTIEAITTSEVNYINIKNNKQIDGFSVLTWYTKTLDLFIESFITHWFRKFAKKQNQIILRVNDPLEKALHAVVNQKFIMSSWRLFGLMKMIKNNERWSDYVECFKAYINKYSDLKNVLLDPDFYKKYDKLINSELLSKKRHSWSITFEETDFARWQFIWNFSDKSAILYRLLSTQCFDC